MTGTRQRRGRSGVVKLATHAVALFPCSSGTETKANPGGPGASLEQEDGEDDTKADTEAGTDEHGGEAAIPLGQGVISMGRR